MYTLTLSERQIEVLRIALETAIQDAPISPDGGYWDVLSATATTIAHQWHAQHVAQRDAALKESTS